MTYISIDGCPGSGKTTLCKLLSEKLCCDALFENYQTNPFWREYFEQNDPSWMAFETEMSFLLEHFHQISRIYNKDDGHKNNLFITDFDLRKEIIFANISLKEDDLLIFKKLFSYLQNKIPMPLLTIFLQCTPQLSIRRIKERNRKEETLVSFDFLNKLSNGYDIHYKKNCDSKITIIDVGEVDFINNPKDLTSLVHDINLIIHKTDLS